MLKVEDTTMKLRTWKYYVQQGINGIFKNGLMSIASIIIVSACALIVILSLAIITNVDYVLKQIESNIGIELFIGDKPTDEQVAELKSEIEAMPHVSSVTFSTSEQALEKAKEIWGNDALDGLKDDNPLPRSLEVKLDGIKYQRDFIASAEKLQRSFERKLLGIAEPADTEATTAEGATQATTAAQATTTAQATTVAQQAAFSLVEEVLADTTAAQATTVAQATTTAPQAAVTGNVGSDTGVASPSVKTEEATELVTVNNEPQIGEAGYDYQGIEYIRHAQQLTDSLVTVDTIFKIAAIALLAVLSIIAIGIIMNTIKLTVFIRKNEISIMKYVGATDWFIRWPFIIEGVVIGLVGAIIPCIFCWFGYVELVDYFNDNVHILNDIARLRPASEIFVVITPVSLLVGALLGSIGSVSSIRKHLRV
jgi:cell division protein FtsX